MERLSIDEIIAHCERETRIAESVFSIKSLETGDMNASFMKLYWEHRQVAEYLKELKAYQEAEEQGLLFGLPCKPEDKLYWISDEDEDFNYEPIEEVEVAEFSYNGYSIQIWFADKEGKEYPILPSIAIGNELFLTREEAEQALEEMEK